MKYLFAALLLFGCSFSIEAAETPAKKKAPAKAKAETKVEVPSAEAVATAKTLTPSQKTKLMDIINKGDDAALQSLPGIGPAKAQNIVKARPVATPADLVLVDGIGEATLAEIVAHAKAGFPVAEAKTPEAKKKSAAKKKAKKE
ncbi:helix-hairpin-helix domain-containing protein [Prosthecobacter sp. SYSU 5D2]|uniref:ComEA family DNA-binding protein n=1 Tax=Prosthecobacter sp. SYSU 5D2 TaxID=3134134 RepID=UPI0031FE57B9